MQKGEFVLKNNGWLFCLLLSACISGGGGFANTPALAEGHTIIWHYNCEKAQGVDVEYGFMGGSYSATVALPKAMGKKTLLQQTGNDFRLDDYRWSSADGRFFTLTKEGAVIYRQCLAISVSASDDMRTSWSTK